MLHHIPDNRIQLFIPVARKDRMPCRQSHLRQIFPGAASSEADPEVAPRIVRVRLIKRQLIRLNQKTIARLQTVFLVVKAEKALAAQDIVDQIMRLGCRSEAVQALRLGAPAAVHIQTSLSVILKIQLKGLFHRSPSVMKSQILFCPDPPVPAQGLHGSTASGDMPFHTFRT